MTDSYYDEIPCPFRKDCTIKHTRLNKAKWKATQEDPYKVGVGKRLLEFATQQMYFLYLTPYGCFGDRQAAQNCGEVIVTTDPYGRYGKHGPVVNVGMEFLNRVPHVLIDEL